MPTCRYLPSKRDFSSNTRHFCSSLHAIVDQIGIEVGGIGEHRADAEIVALQIFDGVEDISADGLGGGVSLAVDWACFENWF